MPLRSWLALMISLAAAFATAAIGGAFAAQGAGSWYAGLTKPAWNPPNWIFGPAWTVLYVLMAVAAWRVWRRSATPGARAGVALYFAQLALNAGWPFLFFGLRRPGLAFAEIVALWALLAATLVRYWRLDRLAGALWSPYVAWVSFATALNGSVWWLNR